MFILECMCFWVAVKTEPLKIFKNLLPLAQGFFCHFGNPCDTRNVTSEAECSECRWCTSCARWIDHPAEHFLSVQHFVRRRSNSPFFLLSSGLGMSVVAWFGLRTVSHNWETYLCHSWSSEKAVWEAFCGWRTEIMGRTRPYHSLGVPHKSEVGLCIVTLYSHP